MVRKYYQWKFQTRISEESWKNNNFIILEYLRQSPIKIKGISQNNSKIIFIHLCQTFSLLSKYCLAKHEIGFKSGYVISKGSLYSSNSFILYCSSTSFFLCYYIWLQSKNYHSPYFYSISDALFNGHQFQELSIKKNQITFYSVIFIEKFDIFFYWALIWMFVMIYQVKEQNNRSRSYLWK
jgi:hypothetical protein